MSNENTILFTIARMNPPTSGHLLLIRNMIQEAFRRKITQVHIILSATVDHKKNPLSCTKKRDYLVHSMIRHLKEEMKMEFPEKTQELDDLAVHVICMDDPISHEYGKHPILKCIQYILQDLYGYPRDNLHTVLLIGEDRGDDYDWIEKSLASKTPSVSMDIIKIDRPEGAMSATSIRHLAVDGKKEEFLEKMSKTGLSEKEMSNLYDEIREQIRIRPSTTATKKRKVDSKSTSRTNSTRKSVDKGGSKKWSLKYKRSINCKRPRGFSQKQYCKYGRKTVHK
jgi:hypothetical protein